MQTISPLSISRLISCKTGSFANRCVMCSKEILIFLSLTADPKTYDKMRSSLQERLLFVFFLGEEESMKNHYGESAHKTPLIGLTASLFSLPVLIPLVVVVSAFFSLDWSTWRHLFETVLGTYLVNTVLLIAGVATLSLILGLSTAWVVTQYEFLGSKIISLLLILPLASPAYVIGYVYAELLDFSGPIQSSLRGLLGWSAGDYYFPAIRSLPGAVLVISLVLYPYIYMLARSNFMSQSGALLEAARTLGSSSSRILVEIALPLARPALVAGLALVLMETIADYGVVEHFGVPTFTTGIFRAWFSMGEYTTALKLAGCLFLMVFVLLILELNGRRGSVANPTSLVTSFRKKQLKWYVGIFPMTLCFMPILLGFVIPVGYLASLAIGNSDSLSLLRFLSFAWNSFSVATIAAILCCIGAIALAYIDRNRSGLISSSLVRLSTLGYALPGLLLAIGLMGPLTWLDKSIARFFLEIFDIELGLLLTGSIFALLLVYVGRFMTISFNSISSGFAQLHPNLDAVARTLGADSTEVLRRIHVPLLRPSILVGMLLVFIDVVKELPATLILRPFNFETLATRVYRLASDERLAEASTAALSIVLLGILPAVLLFLIQDRKEP